ncbi:hypothetical protein [Tropicibacter alexandrii]|uniref:hypothetical protein n=1 Tax=Tropicibacter alexandrii TaxID=2267683 RepID=UPI000EF50638|nr:hypothetical protein [Tropicibacter alexandrii]
MATVAELVQDIAEILGERPETVNAYARALIDSGHLPKSRGRAIAQVGYDDIGKLMLTVALAPKIKEASAVLADYWTIPAFPNSPFEDQTSGKWLTAIIATIYQQPETQEERARRKALLDCNIVINETWTEIEFWNQSKLIVRFQRQPNDFWQGYFKREVRLSGRAFLMLGFGQGRDYVEWVAE